MCQLADMLYFEHLCKFRTILYSLELKNYTKLWVHGNWGHTETGDTTVLGVIRQRKLKLIKIHCNNPPFFIERMLITIFAMCFPGSKRKSKLKETLTVAQHKVAKTQAQTQKLQEQVDEKRKRLDLLNTEMGKNMFPYLCAKCISTFWNHTDCKVCYTPAVHTRWAPCF